MHIKLAQAIADDCRKRIAQGDNPTIERCGIEELEFAVVELSDATKPELQPGSESGAAAGSATLVRYATPDRDGWWLNLHRLKSGHLRLRLYWSEKCANGWRAREAGSGNYVSLPSAGMWMAVPLEQLATMIAATESPNVGMSDRPN